MSGPAVFHPKLVVLMRHAEKTGQPGDRSLSPVGRARALALAASWPERLGFPDLIVACASTPKSTRPYDTVAPLADRLGLKIDARWGSQDARRLAHHLARRPKNQGRRILVCWRHDSLPDLAAAFGVQSGPWAESLYDAFWVIEPALGGLRLRVEAQGLALAAPGPDAPVAAGKDRS